MDGVLKCNSEDNKFVVELSAVCVVESYSVSTFRDKVKWNYEPVRTSVTGSVMQRRQLSIKVHSLTIEYRHTRNALMRVATEA